MFPLANRSTEFLLALPQDTYDDHPSRNDDSGNYGHRDSWRTQGTPTHHVQHVYHRIHTWSGGTTDADTYAFDGSGDSSFESGYEDGDGDRGMEVNSCNHKGRSFSMPGPQKWKSRVVSSAVRWMCQYTPTRTKVRRARACSTTCSDLFCL